VLLLEAKPREYVELVRAARETRRPQHELEAEQQGFHHGEIGSMIARKWGLPRLVIESIEHHHAPRAVLQGDAALALVAVCNQVVHRLERGDVDAAPLEFDERVRAQLGLAAEDVAAICVQAQAWRAQIQI
jgi:HD-like signal output (HDOD) protein